jgi:hypothetical protein
MIVLNALKYVLSENITVGNENFRSDNLNTIKNEDNLMGGNENFHSLQNLQTEFQNQIKN